MSEFKDFTGRQFNDYTVLERAENKHGKARWLCQCKCGEKVILYSSDFGPSRNVKMCRKCFMATFIKHGKSRTQVHRSWQDMMARCDNPKNSGYHNYGGRGIKYNKDWESFDVFYADMGDPPTNKHSLERINVNGDYEKSNCTWATKKEQSLNKRTSRKIEFNGQIKCLSEWCEIYNKRYLLVFRRLQAGWPFELAIITPSLGKGTHGYNGSKKFYQNVIA